MSETFYIKKTAFNDNLVGSPPAHDFAQRELDSFTINPGELNGPGGSARDSDLELFGFGSLLWGEGVDQNQYRQLENFACPQKVTGDYWAAGSPAETAYDSNIHPVAPKDENDLGIGNGITAPLDGQWWYNTTNEIIYIFTAAGTWRNSHTLLDTLDMVGNTIINLSDPDFAATTLPGSVTTINKQDALTVGWSDLRYVNLTGDTMTGILNLSGNKLENIADATTGTDALNRNAGDARYVELSGGETMLGDIDMGGNKITNVGLTFNSQDVINQGYADSRYVQTENTSFINNPGSVKLYIMNDNVFNGGALTPSGGLSLWNNNGAGNDSFAQYQSGSGAHLNIGLDDTTSDIFVGAGVMGPVKNKIWHAGNDGTGSGLDADTLDGFHASDIITTGGITIQTPVQIHYADYNNATTNISRTILNTLSYTGVPGDATHVLLRIHLRCDVDNWHMDMRRFFYQINGMNVAGLGANDTDQHQYADARSTCEVWVPTSQVDGRWVTGHYGVGILQIWVVGYKV